MKKHTLLPPSLAALVPHSKKQRQLYAFIMVLGLVVTVGIALLFGSYLLTKVTPAQGTKITGPKQLVAGQRATITWQRTLENKKRYPYEKIEYCTGPAIKRRCLLIAAIVPNTGKALVKVPASLPAGKGTIKLTARDASRRLVTSVFVQSGTVTVRPAPVAQSEGNGGGGGGGGGNGGGDSGGGGGDSGGGGNVSDGRDSIPKPTVTARPSDPTSVQSVSATPTAPPTIPDFSGAIVFLKTGTSVGIVTQSQASEWKSTTVGNTNHLFSSGIDAVQDAQGVVHVLYPSSDGTRLMHSAKGSDSPQTQVVDATAGRFGPLTMALDGQGKLHAVYGFFPANRLPTEAAQLKYATNVGGSWRHEIIAQGPRSIGVDAKSKIVIDRDGGVHIVLDRLEEPLHQTVLYYGTRLASGGWQQEEIVRVSGGLLFTSLVLDSQNTPHIVYTAQNNRNLHYATRSNNRWSQETLYTFDNSMYNPVRQVPLVLDADNTLHVFFNEFLERGHYTEGKHGRIIQLTKQNGGWRESTVYTSPAYPIVSTERRDLFNLAVTLGSDGTPHLSFTEPTYTNTTGILRNVIRYGVYRSGSWVFADVKSGAAFLEGAPGAITAK